MIQKVIKTGNSLAVTVPSEFVRSLGLKAGDKANMEMELETGKIIYSFNGIKQLALSANIFKLRRGK